MPNPENSFSRPCPNRRTVLRSGPYFVPPAHLNSFGHFSFWQLHTLLQHDIPHEQPTKHQQLWCSQAFLLVGAETHSRSLAFELPFLVMEQMPFPRNTGTTCSMNADTFLARMAKEHRLWCGLIRDLAWRCLAGNPLTLPHHCLLHRRTPGLQIPGSCTSTSQAGSRPIEVPAQPAPSALVGMHGLFRMHPMIPQFRPDQRPTCSPSSLTVVAAQASRLLP